MPEDSLSPSSYEVINPEQREGWVEVVRPSRRRYWVHAVLFLATLLSTLCVGAFMQDNFDHNRVTLSLGKYFQLWAWPLSDWRRLALGIPFSCCLLGILTAHEWGHYILCVRRYVYATLPYFIPAPTMIGTLGAFIRIKSPIRSRTDLFDIGIAGPIAGFVVGVPVLFASLLLSKPGGPQPDENSVVLGLPLIFTLAHWLLGAMGSHIALAQPDVHQLYLHPMAIAAWVGMFATALNLLPGGQLDGGHILFALSPRAYRAVAWPAIVVLLLLSWFFSASWLLWAVVLRLTGRHPPVPDVPDLDGKRRLLAVFGLVMLILTFAYSPLQGTGLGDMLAEMRKN